MKLLCSAFIVGLSVAGRFHLAHGAGPGAPVDATHHQRPEATELAIESTSKDDAAIASLQHLDALAEAEDGTGWTPAVGDTWNYNLDTPVKRNVDVDVFLIDMDDAKSTIRALHRRGKHVVCYISIGSAEEWRDDIDFDDMQHLTGNPLDGWEGELWLDINNEEVRDIMVKRVEKAASLDCDGIEPDNMMVYAERKTGVDVTEAEQIAYNKWFAGIVHANGMKVGLKNCVEILEDLADFFDFAVNESCYRYNECDGYKPLFIEKGKPVFHVEYVKNLDMCDYTNEEGMSTIVKKRSLRGPFCSCVDSSKDWRCSTVV